MSESSAPSSLPRRAARVGLCLIIMGLGFLLWHTPEGRTESPTASQKASVSVIIKNFEFTPHTVTIAGGQTIRWMSQDIANHQITTGVVVDKERKPDGRVASPLLFRGDEFSAVFTTPGTYPYYCDVHPYMRGTIVVE